MVKVVLRVLSIYYIGKKMYDKYSQYGWFDSVLRFHIPVDVFCPSIGQLM